MFGPFVEDWPQVALGFITQEVDDSSDPPDEAMNTLQEAARIIKRKS